MILAIELALALAKPLLAQLVKSKAPQDIIDATSAAIDAWDKHRADLITKPALEAQRG
jgi:hypothetical protein